MEQIWNAMCSNLYLPLHKDRGTLYSIKKGETKMKNKLKEGYATEVISYLLQKGLSKGDCKKVFSCAYRQVPKEE